MFIVDIGEQLNTNKTKKAFWGFIYGIKPEIGKTISNIQINIVEKKNGDFLINFLLNGDVIGCISGGIEEDYVYIDKISNINLNFFRISAGNVNYYTKCLSKELIGKLKIESLGTNMFINFLMYMLFEKKIKEKGITHIKLAPAITSIGFYYKLKEKLLELGLIKSFDETKKEMNGESSNEYFIFYI